MTSLAANGVGTQRRIGHPSAARGSLALWLERIAVVCVACLAGCASIETSSDDVAKNAETSDLIVVAVRDWPEAAPAIGGTPRADYAGRSGYAGGHRGAADAQALADDHGLREQKFWTIDPLHWRCMLYRIAQGADRARVLARLNADPRVALAQPLNSFETLSDPPLPASSAVSGYNDPYLGLQRGFAGVKAAEAQRWSRGNGVRVAVIDTGVDLGHPDLEGRISEARDFAAAARPVEARGESHGTGMAGVIAAGANNGVGIVGIAPQARLLVYRACWPIAAPAGASRCDSFTLAQALGAAINARADVINLSLGGPADPLLRRLTEYAIDHGVIVVGAMPIDGRGDGFPIGVPGVLAVASSDGPAFASPILLAPGREILTLSPGGHYDFASGSSLAAAHVTGAVALLRALDPDLRGDDLRRLLQSASSTNGPVDACAAVHRLRPAMNCGAEGAPIAAH